MPDNVNERSPVESEIIEERDIEPMGEGHIEADPIPRTDLPPPTYEADQGQGGRDSSPGGSTDDHNALTHADSGRSIDEGG